MCEVSDAIELYTDFKFIQVTVFLFITILLYSAFHEDFPLSCEIGYRMQKSLI